MRRTRGQRHPRRRSMSAPTREAALAPTPRRPRRHSVRNLEQAFRRRRSGHPRPIDTFQTTLAPDLSLLAPLRRSLESAGSRRPAWLIHLGPISCSPPTRQPRTQSSMQHRCAPIEIRLRLAAATVAVEIRDNGRWQDAETRERGARQRPAADREPRLRPQNRNRRGRHHAPAAAKDLRSAARLQGSQLR